jgi:hypothetical protein
MSHEKGHAISIGNWVFSIALSVAGSTHVYAAESNFEIRDLVVPGGYATQISSRPGLPVVELSYKVHLAYPKRALPDKKIDLLRKEEWKECDGGDGWVAFNDATQRPLRRILQYEKRYYRRNEMLIMFLQYSWLVGSQSDQNAPRPANATQDVHVIHYDLTSGEVRAQLSQVAPSCVESAVK